MREICRAFAPVALALLIACGAKAAPSQAGPEPAPGSAATPGGAASGQSCGTRGAAACPADQFCSYGPGDDCGATDKPGHCMAKPTACPRIVAPVCGCNGKSFTNGCEAASAGVGVKDNGACK